MSGKISMKCNACGGKLEMDEDRDIIFCPFCGAQEMMIVSDNVKIEKIRSDVSKHKNNNEHQYNMKKLELESEERYVKNSDKTLVIMMILLIVMMAILFIAAKFL